MRETGNGDSSSSKRKEPCALKDKCRARLTQEQSTSSSTPALHPFLCFARNIKKKSGEEDRDFLPYSFFSLERGIFLHDHLSRLLKSPSPTPVKGRVSRHP